MWAEHLENKRIEAEKLAKEKEEEKKRKELEERKNNPTQEDLLKEIRDLLKAEKVETKSQKVKG